MTKLVRCPTCKQAVAWLPENRYRPFCSERCKLIDLGEWAQERYTVPATPRWEPPDHDSSNA